MRLTEKLSRSAGWGDIPILDKPAGKAKKPRCNERRRRCRLQRVCAIRSSETDAIKQRGMEGKGQVIEDSHDLLIAKNLDNCASIQVRCYTQTGETSTPGLQVDRRERCSAACDWSSIVADPGQDRRQHVAMQAFGKRRHCGRTLTSHHHALGLSIPCMVSQLTKALNQPVLVVSLGYMPKP